MKGGGAKPYRIPFMKVQVGQNISKEPPAPPLNTALASMLHNMIITHYTM